MAEEKSGKAEVKSGSAGKASGPRLELGGRTLELVKEKAQHNRIVSQHLDHVIADLEAENAELRAALSGVRRDEILTELHAFRAEQVSMIDHLTTVVESGNERLLNTINGVRYMFELYAVLFSDGDLQEAVQDVNELIDGLSKPIETSRSEVMAQRESEHNEGTRPATEAIEIEQVMHSVDGNPGAMEAASYVERDASEELER